jgi:hypothetical protein
VILFEDGYIKLEYDPGTGVLQAPCPDIEYADLLNIHKAFTVVVKTIAQHNIRKFLLDASRSSIDVSDEDHLMVIVQFASDLMKTNLRQLARVKSIHPKREQRMELVLQQSQAKVPFVIANFDTKADALSWLMEV